MGNKFVDAQANNYFHYDPFTPIYFLPKISEETVDNVEKEDSSSDICTKNRNNSNEYEENEKRKNEIIKERPGKKKKKNEKKEENELIFQEIFKSLEFDTALYHDNESNKYSIEDFYINF